MYVHSVSLKGKRYQNEDKHNIYLNIDGTKDENLAHVNLLSVYDGHGGKFVSEFLEKNIPNFFLDNRVQYPLKRQYIKSVYEHLNNILKDKFENYSKHCGSTCLIVIQYKIEENYYINVLNTGDCRAVLCRDHLAIPLTKDHKPNWPEERRRIEKLGGNIYFDGVDYRIKDLSVSRAFGDLDAQPYLTNMPDIFRYKLDKEDKFIVIACDGLWDVMTNYEVVNFILNNCYDDKLKDITNQNINIASKLAEYAIKVKGSTDNVSIIVLFLK